MKEVQLVTTISGEELPKEDCKYIKAAWHKIGDPHIEGSGDCYLINDRYWRVSTGKIIYNVSEGKYVIKNDNVIEGIVRVQEGELVKGWFNPSIDNVIVYDKNSNPYTALSDDVFKSDRTYRELLATGEYYHIDNIEAKQFTEVEPVDIDIKRNLEYSCDNILDKYIKQYNECSPNKHRYSAMVARYLKDLTFGVEFETIAGFVPPRKTDKLGLIPLRDGSVPGLEYVTVPMSGEKGINALIESSLALQKYTKCDDTCSVHVHIGNIPRTKEFMLAYFKTMFVLQDSIFRLFPLYKKYNFGYKRKNYTKPLPNEVMFALDKNIDNKASIDKNFEVLYKWLSGGQSFNNNFENLDDVFRHPNDPRGNQKWNIKSRYHFVNLTPLLFGNKKTVEFRIHTPTFDSQKIVNFLLLCGVIVNYVKENQAEILNNFSFASDLNMTRLLNRYRVDDTYPVRDELMRYISRRGDFIKYRNYEGDIVADESKFVYRPSKKWSANPVLKINDGIIDEIVNMYAAKPENPW